jgi:Helix-turn-helix domain
MTLAKALMRPTEEGEHCRLVTAKAFEVLKPLLWGFHNARSGRCFPSYETIAAAGLARSTVAEAIKALEAAGLLTWVNRLTRIWESLVARARPSRALPFSLQFRKNHPHARPSLLRRGGSGSASSILEEDCVSAIAASRRASSTSSAVALSATARAAAVRYWSVSRAARSPASSAVSRSMSVFSSAVARSALACACASSPSRRATSPFNVSTCASSAFANSAIGVLRGCSRGCSAVARTTSWVSSTLALPSFPDIRRHPPRSARARTAAGDTRSRSPACSYVHHSPADSSMRVRPFVQPHEGCGVMVSGRLRIFERSMAQCSRS